MEGVRAKVVRQADQVGKVNLRGIEETKHITTVDWALLPFSDIQSIFVRH